MYNGQGQKLYTLGSSDFGNLIYSLDGENYSHANFEIEGIAAGEYTIYYKLANDDNINIPETKTIKVNIAKATPKITPPTPIEGLVYNGQGQNLYTLGSSDVGTLGYSLDGKSYGTDFVISGFEAGEYTIYYKLWDDDNINIPETKTIKVTIAKSTPKITPPTPIEGLVYNGENQVIFKQGSTDIGELLYSIDGKDWDPGVWARVAAGEYTVYYKLADNPNINIPEPKSIKVTIASAQNNQDNPNNPDNPNN